MKFFALFCPILIFLSIHLSGQSPEALFYSNAETVYDVASRDGIAWVATSGGLVRVDQASGQREFLHPANSPLLDSRILTVEFDAEGVLWVGTDTEGIFSWDGNDWQHYPELPWGTRLGEVGHIQLDPATGALWILHQSSPGCYQCYDVVKKIGDNWEADAGVPGLDASKTHLLRFAPDGTPWLFKGNNELVQLAETFTFFRSTENLPTPSWPAREDLAFDPVSNEPILKVSYYDDNSIRRYRLVRPLTGSNWGFYDELLPETFTVGDNFAMHQDDDGKLWLYNQQTLAGWNGTSWDIVDLSPFDLPQQDQFYSLLSTSDGHLWFLQLFQEPYDLFEYDGSGITTHKLDNSELPNNGITHILVDRKNQKWVVSGPTVVRINGQEWTDTQGPGFEISGLAEGPDGNIWAASATSEFDTASIYVYRGESWEFLSVLDDALVTDIAFDQNGTGWFAFRSQGLGRLKDGEWTFYNTENSGLLSNSTGSIAPTEDGIWITTGEGITHFDGIDEWYTIPADDFPAGNGFGSSLAVDAAGFLWFASGDFLLRRGSDDNWLTFEFEKDVPLRRHLDIIPDANGNVWVIGADGIVRYDGNEWTRYPDPSIGWSDYPVYGLAIDQVGNKWIGIRRAGLLVYNELGINTPLPEKAKITGLRFWDQNDNEQYDAGEPGLPGKKVRLLPDSTLLFTNSVGTYTAFVDPGNYEIQYEDEPGWSLNNGLPLLPVSVLTDDQEGFNFPESPDELAEAPEVILQSGRPRCGFAVPYFLTIRNTGTLGWSGEVSVLLDENVTYLGSSVPPDSWDNLRLIWENVQLGPLEQVQYYLTLEMPPVENEVEDLPVLEFLAEATGAAAYTLQQQVTCAFDPNDKLVRSAGAMQGDSSLIRDPLFYTIWFQNLGTDTAFNVVIRDTLDANLDWNTFELVASSHPVSVSMDRRGGLTFVLSDIELPHAAVDEVRSHGFVSYRIQARADLEPNTTVDNTAHIYFDFNPAIVTNTTRSTLVDELVAVRNPIIDTRNAHVFPNPFNQLARLDWDDPSGSYRLMLFDGTGKLLSTATVSGGQHQLDGTALPPGLYFFRLQGERVYTGKFVVA
ncbi:DUF7619 domain-containing protein [Flavilitoribacter nigricans]|uniref:DUF7619 domain-containing protein n=1 Tax=Flavilitoribacter nigricans (strain ATCC 23147 / DSM 23189 / NBRC 102662 / NCIMB 1420 / SS-2) TaxID=1122177 RepID=A0A2D0NEY1_FLAN2|nr:T9SS type A sorting domain-containing protein [Flavilitoribacter nigricans]PHN06930.1 hypothetical protein CRP01_08935 [Flavilitoribacter nigricans DSM 23189 = NBRC 102662]